MEILITVDDGHKDDYEVYKLLEKYKLKGLFFIPNKRPKPELSDEQIKEISNNHDIGGHTVNHALLTQVNEYRRKLEIGQNKKYLENLIGREVTKFAYPRGWYNDAVIESVRQCGIEKAYTMQLGITEKWGNNLSLPRTAHLYPREEYREKGVYKSIIALFDEAKKNDGYFNLAIHGWEVTKFRNWEILSKILKYIHEN